MKIRSWILAVLTAGIVAFAGCSKSDGTASVDPSPVEKSFATAEASLKSAADAAVSAIKKADYSGALAELQKLAGNAKLTDDQKKAVGDIVEQVKKALTDAAEKATAEAKKAVGDIQKSLGK